MNEERRKELLELFESGTNRSLDATGKQRLANLLRDDPEAQALYVEHCQMHAMLAWEHGTLDPTSFSESEMPTRPSNSPADVAESLRRWRWLAIAASVMFLLTASWLIFNGGKPNTSQMADSPEAKPKEPVGPVVAWKDREIVGTLSNSRGAALKVPATSLSLTTDDEIRTGRFTLMSGFVEISLISGVDMVVESPAEFELQSAMRMVMHDGRMSAKVSEQGQGFSVETPSASLVDHGTEFAVDVSAGSKSEVHVFDGEVVVRPKQAPPETNDLRLTTNEATRIHALSGIPEGIDIDHGKFVRSLGEPLEGESEYFRLIRELKPATWLGMQPPQDGVTLKDRGSSPTDATLTIGGMQSPPFKPGRIGSSLSLDGPSSKAYAKVTSYEPSRNGTITLCAWVRAESRPRWAAIAKHWAIEFTKDRATYSGLGGQFHFGLHEDDGDLELQVRDSEGKIIKLREYTPLPLGHWHHVAFVVDGNEVRLYRNGKQVDSAPCNGLATDGPSGMGIGIKLNPDCTAANPTNPGYWHGRIDELAVFEAALSPEQVFRLHKSRTDNVQTGIRLSRAKADSCNSLF